MTEGTTRRRSQAIRRCWTGFIPTVALVPLFAGVLPAAAVSDTECSQKGCSYAEASIDINQGMAYMDGASLGWTREWSHLRPTTGHGWTACCNRIAPTALSGRR